MGVKCDGEIRLGVCVASLTSPHSNRGEYVRNVYLFCLTKKKKKKEIERKGRGSLSLSFIKPSLAVILLTV